MKYSRVSEHWKSSNFFEYFRAELYSDPPLVSSPSGQIVCNSLHESAKYVQGTVRTCSTNVADVHEPESSVQGNQLLFSGLTLLGLDVSVFFKDQRTKRQ